MSSVVPFTKYNSIENHYQTYAVERFSKIVPPHEICVFKEKVHGSNLQVIIDQNLNVVPAKRSGLIGADEGFYGAQELIERLKPKFIKAYQLIQALNGTKIVTGVESGAESGADSGADSGVGSRLYDIPPVISICGEIFGGAYPGSEPIKPVKAVQKGVYYAPDIHFYAFDIRLLFDGTTAEATETPEVSVEAEVDATATAEAEASEELNADEKKDKLQSYLPWSVATKILTEADIFQAEVLASMEARDLIKAFREHNCVPDFPAKFLTTIPRRLGLPSLPDNWAEGYVICPDNFYCDKNGSRQIFKYKNDTFAESVPQKPVKPKTVDPEFEEIWNSVEDTFLVEDYLKNRLTNVLSHEGLELTDNKFRGQIIKLLLNDLISETQKSFPNLSKLHEKELIKKLGGRCGPFVQKCATSQQ